MRVALEKVEGIEKVNVTLKRGVAHITFRPGNSVTLTQLRKVIKDAGYTTRDATVTVTGAVTATGKQLTLAVSGTPASFALAPEKGISLAGLEKAAREGDERVSVTGVIPAPAPGKTDAKDAGDTLLVRSFTIAQ